MVANVQVFYFEKDARHHAKRLYLTAQLNGTGVSFWMIAMLYKKDLRLEIRHVTIQLIFHFFKYHG